MSLDIDKTHFCNNYDIRQKDIKIDTLILHYTALSFTDSLAILTHEEGDARVSCHYLIDRDGRLLQFVDEVNIAWHAGVSYWAGKTNLNANSIGIENVNSGNQYYTDEQCGVLVSLCKDIMERHDIKPYNVLGHSDIAYWRKIDPGVFFPWKELARQGIGLFVEDIHVAKTPWFTLWDKDPFYAKSATTLLGTLGYEIKGLYPSGDYGENTPFNAMRAFELHYCNEFLQEEIHANVAKVLADIILMRDDISRVDYNQEINYLIQQW